MQRFSECKLTLNEEKTKIVHCEDSNRCKGGEGCENSFDYLGYEFRPRAARNSKTGQVFTAFTPAMSKKAVKKIKEAMRAWNLHSKLQWSVEKIAAEINSQVRGWYNYYTKFGRTAFWHVMKHLNESWHDGRYASTRSSGSIRGKPTPGLRACQDAKEACSCIGLWAICRNVPNNEN